MPLGAITHAELARRGGAESVEIIMWLILRGALLPTGNAVDEIDGLKVTLIDNGMPCVIMAAADLGISGYETCAELEGNAVLRRRIEALRLKAGPMMNLGDVTEKSVPKLILVAPPAGGGAISTRCFIPHRCHNSIGVFAAVTVATASLLDRSPAKAVAFVEGAQRMTLAVEHPSGRTECVVEVDDDAAVTSAGMLRTARKLMDGVAFG